MPCLLGQRITWPIFSLHLFDLRRSAPKDGGLRLINIEYAKMHGRGRKDAALLLVTDQSLPAKHRLRNLAVLSSPQPSLDDVPEHNLYHPVVRLMRLMDDLLKQGLSASVPCVPGTTVFTSYLLNILAMAY